jgi:hypothetical protein
VIDGTDYALIDNAFNNQGATLASSSFVATSTAVAAASATVPEPAALVMVAAVGIGLVRRRFGRAG